MSLPEKQIKSISMAGLIHDLGKVAIPSEILCYPGKINGNQFKIVKKHPEVAFDILKSINFPWLVAEMVLQHHERLDGSGYPKQLRAKEIMPESKILAVADVVEAMLCHRPYRKAIPEE